MRRPSVVLMNDTSTRYHHGCARVMRLLSQGLTEAGLTVIARSPARHDWQRDTAFLEAVERANLIVINGEGTLHHGSQAGLRLLKIATHPSRGKTPVAVVNALYQDNPADWGPLLAHCALLAARDSKSAAAMAEAADTPVRWLPDLSLSAPANVAVKDRHGTVIGDSVKLPRRRTLARFAARVPGAVFIPTKTLRHPIWRMPVLGTLLRRALYRLYNGHFTGRVPQFKMPLTEQDYIAAVAEARAHVTGRFHAVCISMLTETPFLAVSSNVSKIEQLLRDAGLDDHRIVDLEGVPSGDVSAEFSEAELACIRAFRSRAEREARQLYRDLADLARSHMEA